MEVSASGHEGSLSKPGQTPLAGEQPEKVVRAKSVEEKEGRLLESKPEKEMPRDEAPMLVQERHLESTVAASKTESEKDRKIAELETMLKAQAQKMEEMEASAREQKTAR